MKNVSDRDSHGRRSVEELLRQCLPFGLSGQRRKPAKDRLEEALGEDMAQQLVTTLAVGSRGRSVSP